MIHAFLRGDGQIKVIFEPFTGQGADRLVGGEGFGVEDAVEPIGYVGRDGLGGMAVGAGVERLEVGGGVEIICPRTVGGVSSQWLLKRLANGTVGADFPGYLYVANSVGVGSSSPTATLDVARGTLANGTAVFRGTDVASHFNYSTVEDTYIRGGKYSSKVYINDVPNGDIVMAQGGGTVIVQNALTVNGQLGTAAVAASYGTDWGDFGGSYGGIRCRKLGSRVALEGLATTVGAGGAVVATLPSGYRPFLRRVFTVSSHYGIIRLDIDTDGSVTTPGTSFSGASQWVSVNGITFYTS